ncbi:MAG: OsmC family protein [Pseudomonadota bacterium]|nr:OsmC family protein [Pseudomonadota bacterium]
MKDAHEYRAGIHWQRSATEKFTDQRYSRGHQWRFDGGVDVPASSSPLVVPLPYSVAAAVDPEEAFIASLSSCHMLFFLSYAAQKGFVIDQYADNAVGTMGRNEQGQTAMLKVVLNPQIQWSGERQPSADEIAALHERAHHDCFLANSVRCEVLVAPAFA